MERGTSVFMANKALQFTGQTFKEAGPFLVLYFPWLYRARGHPASVVLLLSLVYSNPFEGLVVEYVMNPKDKNLS